ncbi:hypothetical protein APHAL10511_007730 [Amanita phalloides]|nr:hypothetical protein APHAL10511_007730 [Amanita phalloides]
MSSHRNRSRHNNAQSPQHLSPHPIDSYSPFSNAQHDHRNVPMMARSRTRSAVEPHSNSHGGPIAFPEPQLYRSISERVVQPALAPANGLVHSQSTRNIRATNLHRGPSASSIASSYYHPDDDFTFEENYSADVYGRISDDFSRLGLDPDEAVKRFQRGDLPETEQEWHKLVPPEAREALGKKEVQRQSVIFEVIKSERDYVADLHAIRDVFISGLRNTPRPIIRPSQRADFIKDVFGNLNEIIRLHERMLVRLFERQLEQHPLVQSVSDIFLDTVLRVEFRSSYEIYIEHYPLSDSMHRKELKNNPAYKTFLESISDDPRVRKRDIITLLSRPVTRLPRLSLLLEQILKLTEQGHPDLESLPTTLRILSDFLKSTQPGIAAAEGKAKLLELCENLEYQEGEIIDLDLNDDSRTVVYSGPAMRRARGETAFSSWIDLTVTLLDNYFILTRNVQRPNKIVKQQLMSRPIPLSHLRCASFDAPSESRRDKSEGSINSLWHQNVDIFPFTVYHASNPLHRRYTLFVTSESLRRRWKSMFEEAIGIYRVRQEATMWYYAHTLSDGFFGQKATGKATTAAPFTSGDRKYIAVGCRTGVHVSTWGTNNFKRVLGLENPIQLAAVHDLGGKQFRRLLVHYERAILSYSLDILARVTMQQAQPSILDASMERVAGKDSNVLFFRLAEVGQRMLVMYASKRLLQLNPTLHVLEAVDSSRAVGKRTKKPTTFQLLGEPGYVPKDAFDISPLSRTVGIVTQDGIVISDPTNFAKSNATLVPDLNSSSDASELKNRLDGAKPLGLVRVTANELMIIYDTLGCYITRRGALSRSAGFVKWETQAQSFAYRRNHVLLFSRDFIEVRDVRNGRLLQTIEGVDIRLLYFNRSLENTDPIVLCMKGKRGDQEDVGDKIVELIETVEWKPTSPIESVSTIHTGTPMLWDEWDV